MGRAYALAAGWRRRRAGRRRTQRRLRQPVISVGSLTAGGAGKTPLAAAVARLLLAAGERPSVLSRGYARARETEGVVVVRDAAGVRAVLDEAGDEPLMLARQLPGCAVLVARHRYLAGVLAESRLGCTVHILDDGFQHVELGREIDLVLVSAADLLTGRPLPEGWLREDASAAALADAWLTGGDDLGTVSELAERAGVGRVFEVVRELRFPQVPGGLAGTAGTPASHRVLVVSGLARPDRFEHDLRAAGWHVLDHIAFPDHHRYGDRDLRRIAGRVAEVGADLVLTSEKDAVRFEAFGRLPFVLAAVPLLVHVEPADAFSGWILERVRQARAAGRPAASAGG
jgi:tetraacyldisaccharide 4'-kinase